MTSKYDPYWARRIPEIKAAVERVVATGDSITLNVTDIVSLGNRQSWRGYVHLYVHRYDADMAHAVSLAHALQKAGLTALVPPGGLDFIITARPDLVIRRRGQTMVGQSVEAKAQPEERRSRATALSQVATGPRPRGPQNQPHNLRRRHAPTW